MRATVYEIVNRHREIMFGFTDINDFQLHETGEVPVEEIVDNPHISLYSLDFDNGRAVFVETTPDVELDEAPFFFIAQFDHAVRVFTLPFDTLIEMTRSIPVDDSKLVFIHSTGRAGSTLASKVFAAVDGVVNMSEPDVLTLLVAARAQAPDNKAILLSILDACVRILCKEKADRVWVVKGRSFVIEQADWLYELYPRAKILFLYRETKTYLASGIRAFTGGSEGPEEERRAIANTYRQYLSPLAPLLAQADPDRFLPPAGVMTLLWLSVMERAVKLQEAGVEMLGICYENWVWAPQETAVAMLDYCGLQLSDLTAVYETLTKDSQAGTAVSRETAQKNQVVVGEAEYAEMELQLREHAFINTADYEVANTIHLGSGEWGVAGGK